jgi:predicted MFS family arabinose efflux permease
MKSSPLIIALGGMIAMAATIGIGRFVYTPILPYMADALALTKGETGLIAAANFLGYLIGSLIGATGVMRGDRRRWTLWALALLRRQQPRWRSPCLSRRFCCSALSAVRPAPS